MVDVFTLQECDLFRHMRIRCRLIGSCSKFFGSFFSGAAIDEAIGYARDPNAANPSPFQSANATFPTSLRLGRSLARKTAKPFST